MRDVDQCFGRPGLALALVIALTGMAHNASAQEGTAQPGRVEATWDASHDTDDFRSAVASARYTAASGLGIKASSLDFTAPGWRRGGGALQLTVQASVGDGTLSGAAGLLRLAGHDHPIGSVEFMHPLGRGHHLGLEAERGLVDSREGIEQGITHLSAALVGDHALTPALNLGWSAGSTAFSDDNTRHHLRTRWSWSLHEATGLNLYLKTRSYRNSDPQRPAYYSPKRLDEASAGASVRWLALPGIVLFAHAEGGARYTDLDPHDFIWGYGLGLASPRQARISWRLGLQRANTATNASTEGGSYGYAAVAATVGVPF